MCVCDRGMSHELPLLAEELLAADGFRRRDTEFSLWISPLVNQPLSGRWNHTHEYISITN